LQNHQPSGDRLSRKFDRTKKYFEEIDLYIHDPLGEDYSDTRIDCEATISGDSTNDLKIVEVIKPLIFNREGGQNVIIQRAVVIVEGR